MRDDLDLDDARVEGEAGRADGRPGRMRRRNELVLDGDECAELRVAIAFEIRALPDVERIDHRDLLEVCARGLQRCADLAEGATQLRLEAFSIARLAFLGACNDARYIENIVDAPGRGELETLVHRDVALGCEHHLAFR